MAHVVKVKIKKYIKKNIAQKKIGEIKVESNLLDIKKNENYESKEHKNSTSITKPTNEKKEIRALNLEKQIALKRSGEYILNHIYQHRKSLNQIKKEGKDFKSTIESQFNKIESYEEIKEEDLNNFNHIMTKEEENQIRKSLRNHFVFKDITEDVLNLIINELIYCAFVKDTIIYKEGDDGNFFYIISNGSVEATEKGKFKKKYIQWECFGELSLITQNKREETIKCLEDVTVFTIDGISFRDIQKRINEKILKERFNFLNTISIFESLDNISKYNVAQKIKLKEFKINDKIINRGDIGDNLYIIKEGLVSCRIGIKEVRKLGNNDYFGQNSILIDVKRGMDIISIQKTLCYELSRNDLKDALGKDYIDVILFCFFRNCVEKSDYLKIIFNESILQDIFKSFKIKIYNKDEKIYQPSSQDKLKANNKRMIAVVEGSIYRESNNELIAEKGKIIGEEIFKDYNNVIPEDFIAHPDCISLEASILSLSKVMKIDLNQEKPLNLLNRIGKLKKLSLFRNLSEKTLELIASKLKKMKYDENSIIVNEDTIGDTFYLISKGRVRITKNGIYIRDLESGNCFGENVLLMSGVKRTATVTSIDKVVCYALSKTDFDIILTDKNMKNHLLKKFALQDTSITLKDLQYIKFLGKGKFGSVSLVHNKKNIYAIKAISRKSVEKQKILAKYFVNERRVMLTLDHPFIVKMVKSMKNDLFCFLLIEYVQGKSLDDYVSSRITKKNIFETQFYISSMLLMLEYLQKKFIAHRDIKPANIMIDTNGYLKMIDFGTAKVLTDYTSTVIGTPHYIAPEILQGKGYSLSCDFWSVGICMFEIFYGSYPFGNFANEVIEIYKEILYKEITFPSDNEKVKFVNSFIKDLLTKKVNLRICNVSNLKAKEFFKDFDFEKLKDFKIEPPFLPNNNNDLSSYLNQDNPYENYVAQDNYVGNGKKDKDDYIPPGYDRNWADEF